MPAVLPVSIPADAPPWDRPLPYEVMSDGSVRLSASSVPRYDAFIDVVVNRRYGWLGVAESFAAWLDGQGRHLEAKYVRQFVAYGSLTADLGEGELPPWKRQIIVYRGRVWPHPEVPMFKGQRRKKRRPFIMSEARRVRINPFRELTPGSLPGLEHVLHWPMAEEVGKAIVLEYSYDPGKGKGAMTTLVPHHAAVMDRLAKCLADWCKANQDSPRLRQAVKSLTMIGRADLIP